MFWQDAVNSATTGGGLARGLPVALLLLLCLGLHLRFLRDRGMVSAERSGQNVYYTLADQRVIQALDIPAACLPPTFEGPEVTGRISAEAGIAVARGRILVVEVPATLAG